jgi:hypothetical protein
MRKRVEEAGTPQRSVQILGQNNQPVFVPGASSSMPTSSFSDFIVSVSFSYRIIYSTHIANPNPKLAPKKAKDRQRKSNTYATKRTYGFIICCI